MFPRLVEELVLQRLGGTRLLCPAPACGSSPLAWLSPLWPGVYSGGGEARVGAQEVQLLHPLVASMNIALFAGIAGGVFAALIIIGIIVYCCCCRDKDEKAEEEDARP